VITGAAPPNTCVTDPLVPPLDIHTAPELSIATPVGVLMPPVVPPV